MPAPLGQSPSRRAPVGAALLMAAAVACGAADGWSTGRLEATWSGVEKGRMAASATAVWCPQSHLAEITALQGDTGFGIVIHPADSLVAGAYPIRAPAAAKDTAPGAAIALRLVGATTVVGYQSQSGTLTLDRTLTGRISGRLTARSGALRSNPVAGAGLITVDARFHDVRLETGHGDCAR